MTDIQKQQVTKLLKRLKDRHPVAELWAHHGDCIESDEQFHDIATELGYFTHVHPPDNPKLRAGRRGDYNERPKPYKIRNQDIVRESDLMIATPHRHEKDGTMVYSGTWATVRIARRRKVPYVIYYTDGRREGGNKWKKFLRR